MPESPSHSALVLAIGGGKGGVGKSLISANLALAMARHGARVVLVDADLGSANLHTLFAIDRAGPSIQSFLDGRVTSLQEVMTPSGFRRVELVRGSVAVPGAANIQHARKLKLLRHLGTLDADVVILDCGAGVHHNVVDFFAFADVRLVVSSPQLISIQNAYGFLKATIHRVIKQFVADAIGEKVLDDLGERPETDTVSRWLGILEHDHPALVPDIRQLLRTFAISLLGNQLDVDREIAVVRALSRMCHDFLGVEAEVLGGILRQSYINESVTHRKPFLPRFASTQESRQLLRIAEMYLTLDVRALRTERRALAQADELSTGIGTIPRAPRSVALDRASMVPRATEDATRRGSTLTTGVEQFRRTVAPPGASDGRRRSTLP